jgi:hypothetical protein
MRNVYRILALAACLLGSITAAQASVFVWQPSDRDLADFDHFWYNSWGVSKNNAQGTALYNQLASGEYQIVGATLRINNIWDWIEEEGDVLYSHLLDDPAAGVHHFWDNQGGGDAWDGDGPKIGEWTDPNGGQWSSFDLIYDFDALGLLDDLTDFILANNTNSYFGFGFDADCHYWNDGVKFKVYTERVPEEPHDPVVPEPGTIALLGIGLAGFGVLRRRRA